MTKTGVEVGVQPVGCTVVGGSDVADVKWQAQKAATGGRATATRLTVPAF